MALIVTNHDTDENGVQSWDATSEYNGPGTTVLRVLVPDNPANCQAHRFLYVLPVKPDDNTDFGDGLEELRTKNFHNLYNCTLIAPSFHLEPYIADSPLDDDLRYETFVCADLRDWVIANLTQTGTEEHWLLSFSKGGLSVLMLVLRHPDLFEIGMAWDAIITKAHIFSDVGEDWSNVAFGTEANFDANYDVLANLAGWAGAFQDRTRLWISGDDAVFEADVAALHTALDGLGMRHFYGGGHERGHYWNTGWIAEAIEGGYQAYRSRRVRGVKPGVGTTANPKSAYARGLELAVLFNEGEGEVITNVGFAPDLTTAAVTEGMTWGTNPFTGEAVLEQPFADGPDFGTIYDGADLTDKTVVAWLRVDGTHYNQTLLDQYFADGGYGGWSFMLTDTGRPGFVVQPDPWVVDDGAPSIAPGSYRMVAATWDATTKEARFFVEGVLATVKSNVELVEQASGAAHLVVGATRDNLGYKVGGAWEQVRLYNRKLTDAQIAALYAQPYRGYGGGGGGGSRRLRVGLGLGL